MTTPLHATCYGICWRLLPYARASFDNLVETAGRHTNVRFVVCHNATEDEEQPAFDAWFAELQATGRATVVKCAKNVMGHALTTGLREVPPRECDDVVVCTDLDLLVPRTVEWLPVAVSHLVPPVNLTGFGLSAVNYRPPNSGWTPSHCFGAWLMTFRPSSVSTILGLRHVVDADILHALQPFVRVPDAICTLYHLTWDAPHEFPAYWAVKRVGFAWRNPACLGKPDTTVMLPDTDAVCVPGVKFGSFKEVWAGMASGDGGGGVCFNKATCKAMFTELRDMQKTWPAEKSFAVAVLHAADASFMTLLARTISGVGIVFGVDSYSGSEQEAVLYARARCSLEDAKVAHCTHLLRWAAQDPVVAFRLKTIQGGVAVVHINNNAHDYPLTAADVAVAADVVLPNGLLFVMHTDCADVARIIETHLAPRPEFVLGKDYGAWQVWRRQS
jgi:hypothetical protein